MPPRIIDPGTVTGPSGTPSTHSHAVSRSRPPLACATTRSPCDCAYADTHEAPVALTPTALYGPIRPAGMSSEHTHVLSMQNGSWPCGHIVQSSAVSHAVVFLLQLQPGCIDATTEAPTQMPIVVIIRVVRTLKTRRAPRQRFRTWPIPSMPNSTRLPVRGAPLVLHAQPLAPDWPWNGATSAIEMLPVGSFAKIATSPPIWNASY